MLRVRAVHKGIRGCGLVAQKTEWTQRDLTSKGLTWNSCWIHDDVHCRSGMRQLLGCESNVRHKDRHSVIRCVDLCMSKSFWLKDQSVVCWCVLWVVRVGFGADLRIRQLGSCWVCTLTMAGCLCVYIYIYFFWWHWNMSMKKTNPCERYGHIFK